MPRPRYRGLRPSTGMRGLFNAVGLPPRPRLLHLQRDSHMRKKSVMPTEHEALPGRATPLRVPQTHFVNGHRIVPPFPAGLREVVFGLGCFWGAERLFWQLPGVYSTAVGYSGGFTPNPTYREVCSARTGHAEVVLVVFDPAIIGYEKLLSAFFEGHDPTQLMRQGDDVGTQYRSVILTTSPAQHATAEEVRAAYSRALVAAGFKSVSTEIASAGEFYYAEGYHQQYLEKNPFGYCGLGGTGVRCPTGILGTDCPGTLDRRVGPGLPWLDDLGA